MLERCQNAQERWGGVHQLIDRWLQERHELVADFARLNDSAQVCGVLASDIEGFCQVLVDYVSAGHFEVYEQLNKEAEVFGDSRGLELAQQIYPRLQEITTTLLEFNDKCDNGDYSEGALSVELMRIGQCLIERFELEDCLIEVLHNAHREQAPASA